MTASNIPFHRVAIVGVGLIGGSWGLALREQDFCGHRVGCDRPEVLKRALAMGAVDEGHEDLRQAVAGAELVILAAPVGEILHLLSVLKGVVSEKALVTDVGSTKRLICERAREALGEAPLFLGGHPLAGKERSGINNADADLFKNAAYALTPNRPEDLIDRRVISFCALLVALGARAIVINDAAHDEAVAWLSHLPQLVSTGLASLVAEKEGLPLDLAASGFRDATRLAESPYALWRDICATNLENIQPALDALIQKLQSLRSHLSDEVLEREFSQALALRKKLREK